MTRRHPATVHRSCDRCGLERSYTSLAFADHHWPAHDCDGLIAAQERVAARAAQLKATAIVRECRCPVARHTHGTLGAYIGDGCRCTPCRAASAADDKRRRREALYGRWSPWMDAGPVREHVRGVMAQGIGIRAIATASGVPYATLSHLVWGHRDGDGERVVAVRCTTRTGERLLAMRASLDVADPLGQWPVLGTARRLRALIALGYSRQVLARHLEWSLTAVRLDVAETVKTTTVEHAREARELYENLSMRLPSTATSTQRQSVTRARNEATRTGWAPPLAWDDEDLDNPVAAPHHATGRRGEVATDVDEAAVTRRLAGDRVHLTPAERLEVVNRWTRSGRALNECERVTGLNPYRVLREAA